MSGIASARVDDDGREVLLTREEGHLCACRGDLEELWSWPCLGSNSEVRPSRSGRTEIVVLNPIVGLDGATGHPLWSGGFARELLDEGSTTSLPRLLEGPEGMTSCRVAMPTSAEGVIQPARGEPAKPSITEDDPRWERRLPWSPAIPSKPQPRAYWSAAWLALINVVVPLAILRRATRGRFWSVRLLLALPVVVTIPVAMFLSRIGSSTPPHGDSATWVALQGFAWTSLLGLPLLAYLAGVARIVMSRRWQRLARLAGLTVLAGVGIGLLWLWIDARTMTALEHYTWSDWYQVVMPGAYTVGVLGLIAWAVRGLFGS